MRSAQAQEADRSQSTQTPSRVSNLWDKRITVAIAIFAATATGVLGTRVVQEMIASPGWGYLDFCWASILAIMLGWLVWTVDEMWNLLAR